MNKYYLLFIVIALFNMHISAQGNNIIASANSGEAKEGTELVVAADLYQTAGISQILLSYRIFGQSEYKKREMLISGNKASAKIPAEDVVPPYLEYYIIVETNTGTAEYYPPGAPLQANPLQVNISSAFTMDNDSGVLILSPEPGEKVNIEQFFVSVSLVSAPAGIDKSKTKMFIDNSEITSKLIFTDNLIVYSPDDEMKKSLSGDRKIRIELFDSAGTLYKRTSFPVSLGNFNDNPFSEAKEFRYNLSLQGETRNESFNSVNTLYNRGTINFSGTYDDWRINGTTYLTSEERSYLQPQHRYSLLVENDIFHLALGDNYPALPSLILDGKRVRGISAAITPGIVNLQVVYGQVTRSVEGQLLQLIPQDTLFRSNVINYNDSMKALINPGTYSRNLLAIRPYFGKGENFQLGFSYLHSSDDKSSVSYSLRPEENVVVGSDLMLGFDDRRVVFTTQAALSLVNEDISSGTFSDALIDSLFGTGKALGGDPDLIKNIKKYAAGFITVNQFLKPLNVEQFSTFASETALNLNYFNNFLKAGYIYRGNDFQSFGQSYVRTDVKGFNFLDRIRLLENRVYAALGYEDLSDNLQRTKFATTSYKNINTSLSYYPKINMPYFTLGYSRYTSNNNLSTDDQDSTIKSLAVNDITNRYSVQLNYDFEYRIKHQTSLSFVYFKRDDMSIYQANSKNLSLIMMLSSSWQIPLMTSLSVSLNRSSSSLTTFNYFSISAGGNYRMLQDRLELSALINPNFGDFKRITLDACGKYYLIKNLSIMLDAKYFKNGSPLPGDSIISFLTRYEI